MLSSITTRRQQDRLLFTRLITKANGKEMIVGNIHAAPLNATNKLRRMQVSEACMAIKDLASESEPCVLIGDFNYPVFKKSLGRLTEEIGFEVSRPKGCTYKRGVVRGNFDLMLTRNLEIKTITTIKTQHSDHDLVYAEIEY